MNCFEMHDDMVLRIVDMSESRSTLFSNMFQPTPCRIKVLKMNVNLHRV